MNNRAYTVTVIAFGGPGRPRHLGFDPARGSKPQLSHDSTPFRDALQFFYSKNRPALRLPGTTQPSLANASFPRFRSVRGIRPRIKREQNLLFKHNELNLLILDRLRQAKSPLTIREIFDAIIQQKGLADEIVDGRAIQKAIDKRLRILEKDSIVCGDLLTETAFYKAIYFRLFNKWDTYGTANNKELGFPPLFSRSVGGRVG